MHVSYRIHNQDYFPAKAYRVMPVKGSNFIAVFILQDYRRTESYFFGNALATFAETRSFLKRELFGIT